jgi:predicted naringenin-chalcone synthase
MTVAELDRSRPAADRPRPAPAVRLLGVGTANPPAAYTQQEVLDRYQIRDERVRSVFLNSAIERRHLQLPPPGATETQAGLLAKHKSVGIELGAAALRQCLAAVGAGLDEVRYLCCVSSTGWLTPGFSALLIRELGLRTDCGRLDVVGMGCNAGLNALAAVAGWSAANPGQTAILLCVEVCSAAYVFDDTMRSAVVNSLFGDGAAALAVRAGGAAPGLTPTIRGFHSCLIPEAIAAMRYDWDAGHGKFSFYLDIDIPYVVGAHAERAVGGLLARAGVRRGDIAHWVVHSGGKKVIDAVKINLGVTAHELRHTTGVLRDYGNLSSGSFLFSYGRLAAEGAVRPGDLGVLMTMGPGSTIETALVEW